MIYLNQSEINILKTFFQLWPNYFCSIVTEKGKSLELHEPIYLGVFLFFQTKRTIRIRSMYMGRKYKLATVVEGDLKAPFLIATTPKCREGATPFPGLLCFTLDTYLMLSVKQGSIKYFFFFFFFFVWLKLGLNPRLPDHWRTLYPQDHFALYNWYIINFC